MRSCTSPDLASGSIGPAHFHRGPLDRIPHETDLLSERAFGELSGVHFYVPVFPRRNLLKGPVFELTYTKLHLEI